VYNIDGPSPEIWEQGGLAGAMMTTFSIDGSGRDYHTDDNYSEGWLL